MEYMNVRILWGIMLVSHNIVMHLNNVMIWSCCYCCWYEYTYCWLAIDKETSPTRVGENWCGHTKAHFTHEPRPMTMKLWEPKRKCPKAVQTHLQNQVGWSRTLECSVEPYVMGPQPNAISMDFYLCGSSHMIKQNKSMVVIVQSAVVSRFCVRPTFKRWFFEEQSKWL
jgi:hypothetical protein